MIKALRAFYETIKNKANEFKEAYKYKHQELKPIMILAQKKERDYTTFLSKYHNDLEIINETKKRVEEDVKNRYWTNILRIFSNKELHQEEESRLGIKYHNLGKKKFHVSDQQKMLSVEKDLEHKILNYGLPEYKNDTSDKLKNYSSNNNQLDELSAKYINSFSGNSYTNKIANISMNSEGVVKTLADTLAGYVTLKNKVISPHTRTWKSRVLELENVLLKNNLTEKDQDQINEIKETLSTNKYLVTKKNKEYQKAISLLEKASQRKKYGG